MIASIMPTPSSVARTAVTTIGVSERFREERPDTDDRAADPVSRASAPAAGARSGKEPAEPRAAGGCWLCADDPDPAMRVSAPTCGRDEDGDS